MSIVNDTSSAITASQLLGISAELKRSGLCCELLNGGIRIMSPTGYEHGSIADEIAFQLNLIVRRDRLGKVLVGETGFLVDRDPDTVRAPDVSFVRADRIAAIGSPAKYFPEAPTLAVEVVSPSESEDDVHAKARMWIAAGSLMVWVVWPGDRSVTVYDLTDNHRLLSAQQTLDGGDVVPGFSVKVADLFVGLS